ncbi:hypothetical protein ACFX13_046160 [Malus domestica]|uniref:Pentacotripeptide-repeat region of PRORP domain-containing protein n=1 Tax=Malus domestica TaxID=3750 RepID=A0A498J678_MALDO|nr:hypothetical protein DVH24_032101 [Malus domestica]
MQAMRQQWRLLLLRARRRPPPHEFIKPSCSQVNSQFNLHSLSSFTSLFHNDTLDPKLSPLLPIFNSQLAKSINSRNPLSRSLSSEPALELKDSDHGVVADIFSSPKGADEIRKELESNNVVISHELVLKVLKSLESSPDVARRFFDWVLSCEGERLSSKSYNSMLSVFGVNGFVNEFWDLVDVMKKKGYGVSKWVQDKALEKFEKDGLDGDVEKLRAVFAAGSTDNSPDKICSRVCKIVRNEVWSEDVERQIRDLSVAFSSDMVKMALESLSTEPAKALIFFRWMEESGLLKHDQQTYNAIARVLGREDCIDRFWKVVDEMRSNGYELEMETSVKVLGGFCKRKMMKDAVDLYEFAMAGANKPSVHCCTFLLRKIAGGKQLDMGLFSRVVRIFADNGNVLTDSMLNAVLKSLNGVGRYGQCNTVFKAMEEGGLVASGGLQSRIAFRLSSAGKKGATSEFISDMEASGRSSDYKIWSSLIEGHCVAGALDKASDCFQKMLEKEGAASAGYAFDILVDAYCRKNSAIDAYKLLNDSVNEGQLKPWHTTYKLLISKLLVQGGFKDAPNILGMMKNHGFPPFIDPFVEYVSKSGTGEDALAFLKAMTSKRFPSTTVFLNVFEAYFKAGRFSEAQNFLSKCPGYIRNHADVLDLFYSAKSGERAAPTAVAA